MLVLLLDGFMPCCERHAVACVRAVYMLPTLCSAGGVASVALPPMRCRMIAAAARADAARKDVAYMLAISPTRRRGHIHAIAMRAKQRRRCANVACRPYSARCLCRRFTMLRHECQQHMFALSS